MSQLYSSTGRGSVALTLARVDGLFQVRKRGPNARRGEPVPGVEYGADISPAVLGGVRDAGRDRRYHAHRQVAVPPPPGHGFLRLLPVSRPSPCAGP